MVSLDNKGRNVIKGIAVLQDGREEDYVAEMRQKKGQTLIKDTFSLHEQFKKVVETFVTEYAFVLNQVPQEEKIMFRYGNDFKVYNTYDRAVSLLTTKQTSKLSATIKVSDIKAFQKESISKEEMVSRILYSRSDSSQKESKDLEILTGIFKRLYKEDLSETYTLRYAPTYEKIGGLGAIVNMKMWKLAWKGRSISSRNDHH